MLSGLTRSAALLAYSRRSPAILLATRSRAMAEFMAGDELSGWFPRGLRPCTSTVGSQRDRDRRAKREAKARRKAELLSSSGGGRQVTPAKPSLDEFAGPYVQHRLRPFEAEHYRAAGVLFVEIIDGQPCALMGIEPRPEAKKKAARAARAAAEATAKAAKAADAGGGGGKQGGDAGAGGGAGAGADAAAAAAAVGPGWRQLNFIGGKREGKDSASRLGDTGAAACTAWREFWEETGQILPGPLDEQFMSAFESRALFCYWHPTAKYVLWVVPPRDAVAEGLLEGIVTDSPTGPGARATPSGGVRRRNKPSRESSAYDDDLGVRRGTVEGKSSSRGAVDEWWLPAAATGEDGGRRPERGGAGTQGAVVEAVETGGAEPGGAAGGVPDRPEQQQQQQQQQQHEDSEDGGGESKGGGSYGEAVTVPLAPLDLPGKYEALQHRPKDSSMETLHWVPLKELLAYTAAASPSPKKQQQQQQRPARTFQADSGSSSSSSSSNSSNGGSSEEAGGQAPPATPSPRASQKETVDGPVAAAGDDREQEQVAVVVTSSTQSAAGSDTPSSPPRTPSQTTSRGPLSASSSSSSSSSRNSIRPSPSRRSLRDAKGEELDDACVLLASMLKSRPLVDLIRNLDHAASNKKESDEKGEGK